MISNLSKTLNDKFLSEISIAIINTCYTNTSAKKFLEEKIKFAKIISSNPGMMNLSAKANEFDISIFYETNGRGNILSNENVLKKVAQLYSYCNSSKDCQILEFISIFFNSANKIIGDSLSTMILIEKCMKFMNLSLLDVYNLYEELPTSFEYIEVDNIAEYKTDDNENRLVNPINIQKEIDLFIEGVNDENAKCFFKLLPDENSVRIYVECSNLDNVKAVMDKAKSLIDIE